MEIEFGVGVELRWLSWAGWLDGYFFFGGGWGRRVCEREGFW